MQVVAVVDACHRSNRRIECKARTCVAAASAGGGDAVTGAVHTHDVLLVGKIKEVRRQFDFVLFAEAETLGNAHVDKPSDGLSERVVAENVNPISTAGTVDATERSLIVERSC